jgi:hypothetical protein
MILLASLAPDASKRAVSTSAPRSGGVRFAEDLAADEYISVGDDESGFSPNRAAPPASAASTATATAATAAASSGADLNEAKIESDAAAEVQRRSLFKERMASRRAAAPLDETDASVHTRCLAVIFCKLFCFLQSRHGSKPCY